MKPNSVPITDIIPVRVVEIGKIKIGGLGATRTSQTGTTWRLPEKYDHFVVTTMHRNEAGDLLPDAKLMAKLKDEYADSDGKVRVLPIQVLSDDIDDILQSSYLFYSGRKMAARSDGKSLTRWIDFDKNIWLAEPVDEPWTDAWKNRTDKNGNRIFKLNTIFNCVITASDAKWGGIYRFRTTSQITSEQLVSTLLALKDLTGGVLRGLPLRLAVRPMRVNPLVKGKATSSVVYVVHVELHGADIMSVRQMALNYAKFELENRSAIEHSRIEYKKLLALPGYYENSREHAEVASEFYPDEAETPEVPASDPLAVELGITVNEPEAVVEAEFNDVAPADEPAIATHDAEYLTGLMASMNIKPSECSSWLAERFGVHCVGDLKASQFKSVKSAIMKGIG